MFKINRESIKPLAADDASYFRGQRYFRDKAVSNVTWSKTNKQYRAYVKGGSRYTVTIHLNEKEELEYTCNCPAHINREGACKHVIATLLFIEHYQEQAGEKTPETAEEKTVFQILNYFEQLESPSLFGEIYRLGACIEVPELFKNSASRAFVSFQAGGRRMYRIPNIRKFLMAVRNGEELKLGKEFQYMPGESAFDPKSGKLLDYLLEIYEICELSGGSNFVSFFSKNGLMLTRNMLYKLLTLLPGTSFELCLYGRDYPKAQAERGNPEIHFELEAVKNQIKMCYEGEGELLPVSEDGSMLFYDNTIYLPDRDFIKSFLPFYQSMVKKKEPLYFCGEQRDKFVENVLPNIHETMKIHIPDNLKEHFVREELRPAVYLDKNKSGLKADVIYRYGPYELKISDSKTPEGVIIIRDREAERRFLEKLEEQHFLRGKDGFYLTKEEELYEFFSGGLGQLKKLCDLFYSEDFKKISVRPAGPARSSIRLSKDSRLLEFDLSFDGIPVSELKDLYHSLQVKKKYFRLRDGTFLEFSEEQRDQIGELFEKLNITAKQLREEAIRLPLYRAVDLEKWVGKLPDVSIGREASYSRLLEALKNPQETDLNVPAGIQGVLRGYQTTGYKWLRTLADNRLGGILADDMGLGKTLQAICYMAYYVTQWREGAEKGVHLVICPTSLVYNWKEEFSGFAPFIRCRVISGSPEERKEALSGLSEADVIITSYPLLRRDIGLYEAIPFHTIFLDEAQFIKNSASQNARCAKQLNASARFALTGTPVENSVSELWSLFDFVMPGFLFSHSKFVERYEKPILHTGDTERLNELLVRTRPFILRRMKQEVLTELPDKIETKILTEMTAPQRKIYLSYLANIRTELFQGFDENGGLEGRSMEILASLTRLRQICCHPATFLKNYRGGSGKLDMLIELVEKLLEGGHRILIFSQFTTMLDFIAEDLKKQNLEYFYLEGATRPEDRLEYARRFNDGERSIFLISLKAGGTGLNLIGADTVIHFDPWWNPAVEDQASDRAHRIGQKRSVQVIKLLSRDSIEEKIYQLQQKKKKLADSVVQSKEVFVSQLTRKELEEIFKDEPRNS